MKPTINSKTFIFLVLILIIGCKKETENSQMILTDIDGNMYKTITLGTQTWMAENLRVTRYRNGDSIGTTVPLHKDISLEINAKYQWVYDGKEDLAATYGRLYTWYVATDERCLCPDGWHLPSDSEWTVLEDYLISNGFNYDGSIEGNKIAKALASDTGWAKGTNAGAVGNTDYENYRNITGFSAVPGGFHYRFGSFNSKDALGYYWSSNTGEYSGGIFRLFYYNNAYVTRGDFGKSNGYSVRCLKD